MKDKVIKILGTTYTLSCNPKIKSGIMEFIDALEKSIEDSTSKNETSDSTLGIAATQLITFFGGHERDVEFSKEQLAVRTKLLQKTLDYLIEQQDYKPGLDTLEPDYVSGLKMANAESTKKYHQSLLKDMDTKIPRQLIEATFNNIETHLSANFDAMLIHVLKSNQGNAKILFNVNSIIAIVDQIITFVDDAIKESIKKHVTKCCTADEIDREKIKNLTIYGLKPTTTKREFVQGLESGAIYTDSHKLLFTLKLNLKTYQSDMNKKKEFYDVPTSWPFGKIESNPPRPRPRASHQQSKNKKEERSPIDSSSSSSPYDNSSTFFGTSIFENLSTFSSPTTTTSTNTWSSVFSKK